MSFSHLSHFVPSVLHVTAQSSLQFSKIGKQFDSKDCLFRDLESCCRKPPLGDRKQASLESSHTSAHVYADCTASPIACECWARPYEALKWKPCSEKGWWWRMEAKKSLRATRLHPSFLFLTIISIVLSTAYLPRWCVKLIIIAYKEIRGRKWEVGGAGWDGVVFVYRKCEVNNFNLGLTLICGCECRAAANTRQSLAAYLKNIRWSESEEVRPWWNWRLSEWFATITWQNNVPER